MGNKWFLVQSQCHLLCWFLLFFRSVSLFFLSIFQPSALLWLVLLLNLRVYLYIIFSLFLLIIFYFTLFSLFLHVLGLLELLGFFYPKLNFSTQFNNINMTLNRVRKCFGQGVHLWGLNKQMDTGSNGVNEGYNYSGWLERLGVNFKQCASVCVIMQ